MSLPVMHPHQKANTLMKQTPFSGGRHLSGSRPPLPPQAEWLYSNAGGTHPTGMMACSSVCFTCYAMFFVFACVNRILRFVQTKRLRYVDGQNEYATDSARHSARQKDQRFYP